MAEVTLWTNRDGSEYGIRGDTTIEDRSTMRASVKYAKEYFKDNRGLVIAEIGVKRGMNSQNMREVLAPSLIVCVDAWDFAEENNINFAEAWHRLHGDPNTVIVKATSVLAANLLNGVTFDLVYIDAGHEEDDLITDLDAWLPRVRTRGILAGHDYESNVYPAVKRVVDRRFGERVMFGCTEGEGFDWWIIVDDHGGIE